MSDEPNHENKEVAQALQSAVEKSGFTSVPPQVHEVTQRHVIRLAELVKHLRAAGVDEAMVRHSTKQLLESYEKELLNVLMNLAGDDRNEQ